jgi:hypothetical protein
VEVNPHLETQMNRRRFFSNLSIGAAALMLRFRPESEREIACNVADDPVVCVRFFDPLTWIGGTMIMPAGYFGKRDRVAS